MTATTTTFGGLLLLASCRRAGSSAMFVWAVAMITASAGLVVAAANRHGAPMLESVGTAALLAASGLFWTATRFFRGVNARWAWVVAGPAAWLVTAPIRTDGSAWIALSCAIGAIYTSCSVRELHRTRSEKLPSWPLAMALTGVHAAVYVGRAGLALAAALSPDQTVSPSWIVPALIIEAMVHINGTALVLVALLLERHGARARASLAQAAYMDGLTGIGNRRRFEEEIGRLACDRRLAAAQIGLILLDLDLFKSINDTSGHDEGDRVLRQVAQVIAGEVRASCDLAARYGGEEFVVLLSGTTFERACRVAERIRWSIEAAAIPHPGTGRVVTVSGGVDVAPAGSLRLRDGLIGQADRALYEAKRRGRNQIVASSELDTTALVLEPFPGAA